MRLTTTTQHPTATSTVLKPRQYRLFISALALLLLAGCAGQPLEDWHTRRLNSEFTRKDQQSVVTFADYQALEDILFREMLAEAYTPNADDKLLLRYSKDSAADPTVRTPNWNRSYELPVANPKGGVLLLHGLSDSPYSLKAMAEGLHEQGYYVVGMRMPGHGTAPSGLVYVHWQDMVAAVNIGMSHLNTVLPDLPLHIVGYSTGASLALDYSLRAAADEVSPQLSSLVLISPAVGVTAAAGLAKIPKGLSKVPGLRAFAYTSVQTEFDPYKYNSFTANAGDLVHKITTSVSKRLAAIPPEELPRALPPMLVFHSTVDATVSTDALVDKLLKKLDPNRHELVMFDINRNAAIESMLVDNPAPVTDRLIEEQDLPFGITLISNRSTTSQEVVAYRALALQNTLDSEEELGLSWPEGVISLSHVALPIAPEDRLYGAKRPNDETELFLGDINIKGEKGLLKIPDSFLVRLRHNPFYPYLEQRAFEWIDTATEAAKPALIR